MFIINKTEAAVDQLDWAIRLFLDSNAYVPAITLAGACDGILGGLEDSLFMNQLKSSLAKKYVLTPKKISDEHINRVKNWLKHASISDNQTIELDLKNEAIMRIIFCICSLLQHDKTLSSETPRLITWMKENGHVEIELLIEMIKERE